MNNASGFEFPKPFIRQGAFPLDASSIFNSLEEAKEYVNNNGIAYIGQLISVVDKEKELVELYMVGYSGTIIRIDGIQSISGDNKSIEYKNGVMSLFAFENINKEGMSIRTKSDGHGGYILEWYDIETSLSDFVERLTNLEKEMKTKVSYSDAIDEEIMQQILNEILIKED